jgi:hypothetical protein
MKTRILCPLLALGFTVVFIAQTVAVPLTLKIRAEIPFDFSIGSKRLPKGEYTIESVNDTGSVLLIRDVKKGKVINFTVVRSKMLEKPKSKLVFNRYGDQYFLARIWDGSSDTILKLNKSKAEKRMAKAANREANPEEVPISDVPLND